MKLVPITGRDNLLDELLYETIKRHAGLSDWEQEPIEAEVRAIRKALKDSGFVIGKQENIR